MAIATYTPWQLDPEFFDRIQGLQKRVGNLDIIDGGRTMQRQQKMRDISEQMGLNPDDYFAKPEASTHTVANGALGADLVGNLKDAQQYSPQYGLYFPLQNDPWHVEPVHVSHDGLPYRAAPAPVQFDFTNTTPTGDRGLDANLQNQAAARAHAQAGTVPENVPRDMLAPELLAKIPLAQERSQQLATEKADTAAKPAAAPSLEGAKTRSPEDQIPQATPQAPAAAPTGPSASDVQHLSDVQAWNAAAPKAGGSGAALVNAAMAKVGKPYSTSGRFGPNAYDCSGLVVAALKDIGIDPGGNTVSKSLQTWGQPIDLETAYNTPGAMLFVWGDGAAGHVEISRGDGTTIGSSRGGVMVRPARGRGWTGAALPPGISGGAPAAGGGLPAGGPARIEKADLSKDMNYMASTMWDILRRGSSKAGAATARDTGITGADLPATTTPVVGGAPQVAAPQQAPAQAAPTDAQAGELPPGAPPPVSQPGNPNPVSVPSPVAQGEVFSQQQKETGGHGIGPPSSVTLAPGAEKTPGGLGTIGEAELQGQDVQLTPEQAQAAAPEQAQQPPGQQAQGDFYARLLSSVGAPDTPENRRFLEAWQRAEGGSPDNPFNTTQGMPGATNFNSVGVKRYASVDDGLMATVKTLTNGKYENILAALRAGNDARSAAQALAASPWGTGGLVLRILG